MTSEFTFQNWMTQLGLYCENSILLGSIGSSNFFGLALGCFCIGRASDIFGRKPTLMFAMFGCVISMGFMIYANSLGMLFLSLFLYGFFNGIRSICAYALCVELVHPSMRKTMSVITNISICVGLLFASLIFRLFKSSHIFLLAVCGIMIFATLVISCIPESPEFLYSNYKFDKLRRCFNFIAWINRKPEIDLPFDKEAEKHRV